MIEINRSEINDNQEARLGTQSGFTFIDVLMAIAVMTIGMLGLLMTLTMAMVATTQGQQEVVAKQFATSTMESIFSARDINNPVITSFAVIANNTTSGGIFLTGYNPIYVTTNSLGQVVPASGANGVVGTADDGTGTGVTAYPGFMRSITITDISNSSNGTINLLRIVVSIQYKVNNLTLTQTMTSYLANYNTQSV
jgi:type II secretory pathway pseudopilin PulG